MFTKALFRIAKIWKQAFVSGQMDKCGKYISHMNNGIFFSQDKEGNPSICDNINEL